ncbi:MAG TPA: GNAT family N-acetyltransferase [Patescibacteria group bacterium]|nr:GNAT family N-acetyltransferase [Patescibacteria group bacterium]
MKPQLQTKRLILHATSTDNFDVLYHILTDDYVKEYLCDGETLSHKQVEAFITQSEETFKNRSYGLWLLKMRESGDIIGFAGLWDFFDEVQPQLLYALLPEFAGEGFATEASRAIIHYAFRNLGYSYLLASFDVSNTNSKRMVERLGMEKVKEEIIDAKPIAFYRLER